MSNEPENEKKLPGTSGGQPQERVEDRPDVGVVSPSEYPEPANADSDMGEGEPGESAQNYEPRGTSAGADKGREG